MLCSIWKSCMPYWRVVTMQPFIKRNLTSNVRTVGYVDWVHYVEWRRCSERGMWRDDRGRSLLYEIVCCSLIRTVPSPQRYRPLYAVCQISSQHMTGNHQDVLRMDHPTVLRNLGDLIYWFKPDCTAVGEAEETSNVQSAIGTQAMASTRLQGWRDEAPKGVRSEWGHCLSPENLLFCDFEMVYFGEFWGATFKVCNNIGGYSHWRPLIKILVGMCLRATSLAGLTPVDWGY